MIAGFLVSYIMQLRAIEYSLIIIFTKCIVFLGAKEVKLISIINYISFEIRKMILYAL